MSWRTVIISSTAKLDYQMGYLVIRKEEAIKIHLSEIEILMIESYFTESKKSDCMVGRNKEACLDRDCS